MKKTIKRNLAILLSATVLFSTLSGIGFNAVADSSSITKNNLTSTEAFKSEILKASDLSYKNVVSGGYVTYNKNNFIIGENGNAYDCSADGSNLELRLTTQEYNNKAVTGSLTGTAYTFVDTPENKIKSFTYSFNGNLVGVYGKPVILGSGDKLITPMFQYNKTNFPYATNSQFKIHSKSTSEDEITTITNPTNGNNIGKVSEGASTAQEDVHDYTVTVEYLYTENVCNGAKITYSYNNDDGAAVSFGYTITLALITKADAAITEISPCIGFRTSGYKVTDGIFEYTYSNVSINTEYWYNYTDEILDFVNAHPVLIDIKDNKDCNQRQSEAKTAKEAFNNITDESLKKLIIDNGYYNEVKIESIIDPSSSILNSQSEFIASVTENKTIDRASDEYKAFVEEYITLTDKKISALENDDAWKNFINAAKSAFADGIDDNFEDKFYTDMKWINIKTTAEGTVNDDSDVSTVTYGESNTGIKPLDIGDSTSEYRLTASQLDFDKVKYVTFDYIPTADSTIRIYPFYSNASTYDKRYAFFIEFKASAKSITAVCPWICDGNTGIINKYLINAKNDFSNVINSEFEIEKSDISKYMNIAYNKAFKVIVKYESVAENNLKVTLIILDNVGNKVCSGNYEIKFEGEGLFDNNSYFAIPWTSSSNKVIIDNVKSYTDEKAEDFNVKYANMLAYDADALSYVQASDIKGMAAEYETVTDKENVNKNYDVLKTVANKWTDDQAESFKTIYADALKDGATEKQVQNAWCVLNSLDVSAKDSLKNEREILKNKLGNTKSSGDTVKISFIGDSQTDQASKRNEGYHDYLMKMITEYDTENTYEYIKLGITGFCLTSSTPGMSCHESNIFWQYNKTFSPDIIFLLIGTNDARQSKTDENFTATLKRTVQILQSLPSAPTVVLVSPYSSDAYDNKDKEAKASPAENLPKVQAAMQQVQSQTGCAFVDIYEYTNNCTDAEKEVIFKRDKEDLGSKYPEGWSDGLHPGSVGRKLAAEYIFNTFFKKISVEFATDAIRSYDHSYADNYENYLGYSYYGLDDATKANVKNKFTEEQKAELIAASVPQFGLKATGLDVESFEGANGQLVYHVKYDTSALDAFGKSYTYGMIAVPNKALADKSVLTHSSEISIDGIKLLDIKGSGIPSSNLYFRLLGSENLKSYRISARAYICVDGKYIYSDDTVTQSVNAERRLQASKMIDLSYKNLTKNKLSYTDSESAPYFTGFETEPTAENIDSLLNFVTAGDKTNYADTDAVYKFIKENYKLYMMR